MDWKDNILFGKSIFVLFLSNKEKRELLNMPAS